MTTPSPSAGDVAKLVEELWLAAISATPGEWKLGRGRVVGWINESDDQSDGMLIPIADVYGENPDADGAWIALASPRNITKLLTALESLSRELAGAREDAERNLTDARKRCSELTALVDTAASIFENCSVESGMCCCGEPMEGHPDPMSCGHSATDHGGYVSVGWHNRARSVLSREKEAAR